MLSLEQKIYSEKNDSILHSYYLKKFNLSIPPSNVPRSFMELKRVDDNYISDSTERVNFYWNACLISKLNGSFDYANIYYDLYLETTRDSSYSSLILGYLVKEERDTSLFNEFKKSYENDTVLACFDCFNEVNSYTMKRKISKSLIHILIKIELFVFQLLIQLYCYL